MATDIDNFIQTQPLFWENRTISDPIIPELRRRSNAINIGQSPNNFDIFSYENKYTSYKGHMVPWIRIFSNGTGQQKNSRVPISDFLKKNGKVVTYDGFLLSGGKDFENSYGFSKGGNNQDILQSGRTVLGYEANGNPHYIDPIYKNMFEYSSRSDARYNQNNSVPAVLPAPGVESFGVRLMKDTYLTETKFKFKCYTLAQLEYMIPFFLTPGITVFVEFGWNVFNYNSLLSAGDFSADQLYELVKKPWKISKRIYDSRGNYGLIHGLVTDYNFNTTDNYTYECNVTLLSSQNFYESNRIDHDLVKHDINDPEKPKYTMNFKSFLRQKIPFLTAITNGIGNHGPSNFIEFFQKYLPLSKDEVVAKKIGNYVPTSYVPTVTPQYINVAANGKRVIKSDTGEYFLPLEDYDKSLKETFYGGKVEDRVFTSRDSDKYIISDGGVPFTKISRESDVNGETTYTSPIYFDTDKNIDFDTNSGKDGNESKLWMTLGLLVDIINYNNRGFNVNINIDDVIINAHPNLISCDSEVLIPNPIAPKINHGQLKAAGGFLDEVDQDNKFDYQLINFKYKDAAYSDVRNSLNASFTSAHAFFKTYFKYDRQDLDRVINYKRYNGNSDNKNLGIPFIKDEQINQFTTYEKYRYGFLKNIYVSDAYILQLANDDSINTFGEFIDAVLKKINDSVGGYWAFELVYDDQDGKNKKSGNYTIVDKSLNNIRKVYQFELGGARNVIKNINFDVKLSNEQANQVINSMANNSDSGMDGYKLYSNQKSLPNLAYIDRFDKLRVKDQTEENDKLQLVEQQDDDIQQFQVYGNVSKFSSKNKFLMVTGKSNKNDKIYYHLNLPRKFLNKLNEMLDDGDHEKNVAKYSNIADNFLITLTLDGNYGFKPLQIFSISNLPKPYVSGNCLFQIMEVGHVVNNGKWDTEITAMLKGDYPDKNTIFEKV